MCRAWRDEAAERALGVRARGVEHQRRSVRRRSRRRSARGSSSPDSRSASPATRSAGARACAAARMARRGRDARSCAAQPIAGVPRRAGRAVARPRRRVAASRPRRRGRGRRRRPRRGSRRRGTRSARAPARPRVRRRVSYSPWMSGVTASKRVKPSSASTSRRRWSCDDAADRVGQRRACASVVGQPAGVEVGVDRHVVAVALGRGEQGVELDQLDRPLSRAAALALGDRVQHVVVGVTGQSQRRPAGLRLMNASSSASVDDLEDPPRARRPRRRPRRPASGQRQRAHHLGEVGVRRGPDQQAARQAACPRGCRSRATAARRRRCRAARR